MMETYIYYMTQRPPAPGAMSTAGLESIEEYEDRRFVDKIWCEAYAKLTYNRKLADNEISDYELAPECYDVRFTRAEVLALLNILQDPAIAHGARDAYQIFTKLAELYRVPK